MNQQGLTFAAKRGSSSVGAWHLWWLLALTLWFLTACGLLNRTPAMGDAVELQGPAVITCSPTCAARGQCGTTPDGDQVVLGGQNGPTVEEHDRLFPANMNVNIIESRVQVVEFVAPVQPAAPFELRFYHVLPPDRPDGWVSGWCLMGQ